MLISIMQTHMTVDEDTATAAGKLKAYRDVAGVAWLPTLGTSTAVATELGLKGGGDGPTCFFMKSEMTDLPCPSWLIEKLPSLLRRMHAGMDGNTRMASRLSRTGLTASTICRRESRLHCERGID